MEAGEVLRNRNRRGSLKRLLALPFIWPHDAIVKLWKTSLRSMLLRKAVSQMSVQQEG